MTKEIKQGTAFRVTKEAKQGKFKVMKGDSEFGGHEGLEGTTMERKWT